MEFKTCTRCEKTKPLTARHWQRDSHNATGYHSLCKRCRCEYDRRRDKLRNQSLLRKFVLASSSANGRARAAGVPGTLTAADIARQWTGTCYWCRAPVTASAFHLDHKKPLGTAFFCGDNSPDNICISCPDCNQAKAGQSLARWLSQLAARGIRHPMQPEDMPIQKPLPDRRGDIARRIAVLINAGVI